MIPVNDLIRMFQRMNAEHWRYTWGSAKTGDVDCSGAFVWAYSQYDKKIYHGSNRIAREYVVELLPITAAQPGMAAFKTRTHGEDYYSLPQGYLPGGGRYNGDLNDYYHIGLVDEDPRYVLNAKSTADGFKRSPISENWDFVAKLKAVSYDTDAEVPHMETMYNAMVAAPSGGTVRMRKLPTPDAPTLLKVPVGSMISVYESTADWARISYDGTIGYMMAKYISEIRDEPEDPEAGDTEIDGLVSVQLPKEAALELYRALGRLVDG